MRILVTGASGQLGRYTVRRLIEGGNDVVAWTGRCHDPIEGITPRVVDLGDLGQVEAAFNEDDVEAVIHTGAITSVAAAHADPERAWEVNASSTGLLAAMAAAKGTRLLYASTDMVFDGKRSWYRETDTPAPLSHYAHTKLEGELAAISGHDHVLVLRIGLLYGPVIAGEPKFFDKTVTALRNGEPVTLFEDEYRTPLDVHTAAEAAIRGVQSDAHGVLHVGGPARMSRHELGLAIADAVGADRSLVNAGSRNDHAAPEPRPKDLTLDSTYWRSLFPSCPWPRVEEALPQMNL